MASTSMDYLTIMGYALGVLVSYVAASAFFWHHPNLLHKRKKSFFNALHISHRGGAAEGYENTLKNFQKAVDSGTEMLELDVRLTRDGQVVVYHDPNLKRLTGIEQKIADLEYHMLPPLNSKIPIDFVPGSFFSDSSWTDEDRRIPLLSQVFRQFPDTPINIDIKENNAQLITEVSNLIHEHQREDKTVWGSFDHSVCELLYKTNPNVGLFCSARKVVLLFVTALTGVLPFIPLKETHYEVFLPVSIRRLRMLQGPLSTRDKLLFWISDMFLVWRPLIKHLRKRGINVYLWVANTEDEYAKCLEVGANGIMTDNPRNLRQFLDNYAKEQEKIKK